MAKQGPGSDKVGRLEGFTPDGKRVRSSQRIRHQRGVKSIGNESDAAAIMGDVSPAASDQSDVSNQSSPAESPVQQVADTVEPQIPEMSEEEIHNMAEYFAESHEDSSEPESDSASSEADSSQPSSEDESDESQINETHTLASQETIPATPELPVDLQEVEDVQEQLPAAVFVAEPQAAVEEQVVVSEADAQPVTEEREAVVVPGDEPAAQAEEHEIIAIADTDEQPAAQEPVVIEDEQQPAPIQAGDTVVANGEPVAVAADGQAPAAETDTLASQLRRLLNMALTLGKRPSVYSTLAIGAGLALTGFGVALSFGMAAVTAASVELFTWARAGVANRLLNQAKAEGWINENGELNANIESLAQQLAANPALTDMFEKGKAAEQSWKDYAVHAVNAPKTFCPTQEGKFYQVGRATARERLDREALEATNGARARASM